MHRYFLSRQISEFIQDDPHYLLGILAESNPYPLEQTQRDAWQEEIRILKLVLDGFTGTVYFEYSIPRMGKRIDVVCIIGAVVFILEFKAGQDQFLHADEDQVMDYALDLKNFHEQSHELWIAPVLVATEAQGKPILVSSTHQNDKILFPIRCNKVNLREAIENVIAFADGEKIDQKEWASGGYHPTPTIVEAATALYRGHSVSEISRSDAGAKNLSQTTDCVSKIIERSLKQKGKSICFVTGVPGAGKTLVGLNIATLHMDEKHDLYSVYLSGNGPLVAILREALTRDKVHVEKEKGNKLRKYIAMNAVKQFIQNVHNFRDECLIDETKPPIEHVVLFDEAQRAWNLEQTENFMARKRDKPHFGKTEPDFLISCLDRHHDWAVIVCLVGGGQEINTGEAGISEWIRALRDSYPDWNIYLSPHLSDSEYAVQDDLNRFEDKTKLHYEEDLHLSVSMRSFRAENVSLFVKQILDRDAESAKLTLSCISANYPIMLTRNLQTAKEWLKNQARGSERYGIVVSSQAERLKPYAIDVKFPTDPIHWFLDGKDDIRSSYYLEDVATEFDIQGLELDWACVTWDADFRYTPDGWVCKSFVGTKWNNIKAPERQLYLKNAYRVLLTRARQGMVIVVPEGDPSDPTRKPEFYDPTFKYLKSIGLKVI